MMKRHFLKIILVLALMLACERGYCSLQSNSLMTMVEGLCARSEMSGAIGAFKLHLPASVGAIGGMTLIGLSKDYTGTEGMNRIFFPSYEQFPDHFQTLGLPEASLLIIANSNLEKLIGSATYSMQKILLMVSRQQSENIVPSNATFLSYFIYLTTVTRIMDNMLRKDLATIAGGDQTKVMNVLYLYLTLLEQLTSDKNKRLEKSLRKLLLAYNEAIRFSIFYKTQGRYPVGRDFTPVLSWLTGKINSATQGDRNMDLITESPARRSQIETLMNTFPGIEYALRIANSAIDYTQNRDALEIARGAAKKLLILDDRLGFIDGMPSDNEIMPWLDDPDKLRAARFKFSVMLREGPVLEF